jgi:hypothetical protein
MKLEWEHLSSLQLDALKEVVNIRGRERGDRPLKAPKKVCHHGGSEGGVDTGLRGR